MYKKILLPILLLTFTAIAWYWYLNYKRYIALDPKKCWIDIYDSQVSQKIDELNVKKDFETNIRKKDYRFVSVLGMSSFFPSLSIERDENLIADNGSKMICIGDVDLGEGYGMKSRKAYEYAKEYNWLMLQFLKQN